MSDGTQMRVGFAVGERSTHGLWTAAAAGQAPVAVAVLAHGAGSSMQHAYLDGVVEAMAAEGIASLRFNFPYADAGRGYPDQAPVLMQAWRAALAQAAAMAGELPLVAGGKSLGGRIASMVAAEDGDVFAARALVFFGYPLHAPGKEDRPRDAHLSAIRVPMLFIEGTRDPFARFDLIDAVVTRLAPSARMHVIDGGDHSHRVRGVRRSDRETGAMLGDVAAAFIRTVVS